MNLVIFEPKSSGDVPTRFIQEAVDKATHDFWVTVIVASVILLAGFVVMWRLSKEDRW